MADQARVELRGWKEIAGRLEVSVRTVQRWEAEFGLPVHRLQHRRGSVVVAFSDELEQWRRTAGAWHADLNGVAQPPTHPGAEKPSHVDDQPATSGDAEVPSGRNSTPGRGAKSLASLGGLIIVVAASLVWLDLTTPPRPRAAPQASVARRSEQALVMRGVIVGSVLDEGRTVVLTIDRHQPSVPPDGKADEGFLLQLDPGVPNLRIPVGYGEVTIRPESLAITVADGDRADFVVTGRASHASSAARATPLVGLARYPDLGGVSHGDFVARIAGT
jgi:hypothetical protein